MSNTQKRWVKILPSAVESKYEKWSEDEIGGIWQADFYDTFVELDGGLFTIEPHHVQEVYVYDEPMELPTTDLDRISELEAQKQIMNDLRLLDLRLSALEQRSEPQQPAPQTESNLDKAKRMYPKGTRFKSAYLEGEYVSSGEIREATAKDGNIVCIINKRAAFLFCDGQWAERV